MAELGILLVGPEAAALAVNEEDVPVVRVRSETITPLDEDLEAMVGYAASGTFHGPDADRWKWLDPDALRTQTEVLWACAQVQSAAVAQLAATWDRALVVSWIDEAGLAATVRALATLKRPLTVLLGGSPRHRGRARANQVVLADLLRHGSVTMVIHNEDPERVLDVVIDTARSPQPTNVPRPRPIDVGAVLDLPPTWCMPASPVQFFQLVHVPMGYAAGLPQAARCVAVWRALQELLNGPPVDMPGVSFRPPEEGRARLPSGDVHGRIRDRIRAALAKVAFRGDQLLVEQIDAHLRPALDEVRGILKTVVEVERMRLQRERAFTAVGIHYTVQNLDSRLDRIQDTYPDHYAEAVEELMEGESEASAHGSVPLHAWRHAFAGLTSEVMGRNEPGSAMARKLVQERFELFRSEFAAEMARLVTALVERARAGDVPPSTRELRALRDRAVRVRDVLEHEVVRLEARIDDLCAQATKDDRFIRWATPHGSQLKQLLSARIASLPVGPEADRRMTEALSRRPLGMADDRDFEAFLQELAVSVHTGVENLDSDISYESVLLMVLQGRDPPVLRQALAKSAGTEVELHLERPVEPALMSWLTATGMLVVVAPRLQTCAIYWQRAESLSAAVDEQDRDASTEHRLADLMLPPPDGDSLGTIAARVRAVVYLLVGMAVGELVVVRQEGVAAHRLVGRHLEMRRPLLLPHSALHAFSTDDALLARLRARVELRMAELPTFPDAVGTVRKLMELAALGPAPTLAAQIGLYGASYEHLESPIQAMLQHHANVALTTMIDVLHTDDLVQLVRTPTRRALLDVQQLGPTGG